MEATLKIVLDERTQKKDGTYPVKLRITWNRKSKYFPAGYDMTKTAFDDVFSKKPSKAAKEVYLELSQMLGKAKNIIDDLRFFSFENFENAFYDDAPKSFDAFTYYDNHVREMLRAGRAGSAECYDLSKKSILKFLATKKRTVTVLPFEEITASWLEEYERFMISNGKSITTVGIYLRPLRALYRKAIADRNAVRDLYPFGKGHYQIPARRRAKKALSKSDLKILFEADLANNPMQQRARDFWFFSYACNGINLKDVALLRWENVELERIVFVRAKTSNTTRHNQQEIIAYRTPFLDEIIKRYGSSSSNKKARVFDLLPERMSAVEERRIIKNHTRFVNQHMKQLAKDCGVTAELSYVWARHSFTTNAIREGATLEEMRESLGHQSILTTQNYFAGFEDERKKKLASRIMDFSFV